MGMSATAMATAADQLPASLDFVHTEVGMIPADWSVSSLGKLGSFMKGKGVKRGDVAEDGVPCIRYGEIYTRYNDYVIEPASRIPEKVATLSQQLQTGDLLFAASGETAEEIGKCVAYLGRGEAYAGGDIVILRPSSSEHNPLYLGHLLNHPTVSQQKARYGQGDAVVHISARNLALVNVPLPPSIDEQNDIADALFDVDRLIESLDALISKKRAIKQATMQQLLTGKTRLPGFTDPWTENRVDTLGHMFKGRGIKRDEVLDDGVPCIRYGELYTRYRNYVSSPISHIAPDTAASSRPIQTGDLLFAGSGETAEEIGTCVAYIGESVAYAGGDIIVLRPQGCDPVFLGHLMNHPLVAVQKARHGQGDAVVHINGRHLAQVTLELPTRDEQEAIARVALDMDREITALCQRRDKTQAIKQGMMQQLLTG
ncbi:MAG: restriction endonuclease subunit S, partial [Myxococcales bacterium]|nr:restriction endonuclease subunit S [Myxococcales bacterium]